MSEGMSAGQVREEGMFYIAWDQDQSRSPTQQNAAVDLSSTLLRRSWLAMKHCWEDYKRVRPHTCCTDPNSWWSIASPATCFSVFIFSVLGYCWENPSGGFKTIVQTCVLSQGQGQTVGHFKVTYSDLKMVTVYCVMFGHKRWCRRALL